MTRMAADERIMRDRFSQDRIAQHHRKQDTGVIIDADLGSRSHAVCIGERDLAETPRDVPIKSSSIKSVGLGNVMLMTKNGRETTAQKVEKCMMTVTASTLSLK